MQAKVEELNRRVEKENQLKNLTSLNLSAALESTTKSMASEKVATATVSVTLSLTVPANAACGVLREH